MDSPTASPHPLTYYISTRQPFIFKRLAIVLSLWLMCSCFLWLAAGAFFWSSEPYPTSSCGTCQLAIDARMRGHTPQDCFIAAVIFVGVAVFFAVHAMRQYYVLAAQRRGPVVEPAISMPQRLELPPFLRRRSCPD